MKKQEFKKIFIVAVAASFILPGTVLLAKEKGPPADAIRDAYRQILAGADKNGDGKLSMAECTSISKNKAKIEKDCKYWDANGDGFITEEEYVQQVQRIMRR